MQIRDGIVEAIGHTPLIKLKRASAATGCTILGKAEFMNPGGSVKDRAGRQMILEAEKRGELRPGGLVVEATAGNTGIGLALVANARGYRTLIVIPDTQSQEKKDMLRLCGAELVEVPALPYSNPNNYQHVGRRLAEQLKKSEKNGVIFADQWNNLDNRKAHYVSTGPEIWEETGGKIDGFICAIGTGGTIAGVSSYLREKKKGHRHRRRRSARRRHVQSVRPRRGESERRRLDHRGHRARPRDADHRRREGRQGLSHSRRGSRADHFRSARARRSLPRRLVRHQCRRRHSAGEGSRPRPHHRDGARRLRHALSVEAVQSGFPALEKSAGAGMAGAQVENHQAAGPSEGNNVALVPLARNESRIDANGCFRCRQNACSATTPI